MKKKLKYYQIKKITGLKWFYSSLLMVLLFTSCDSLNLFGGIATSGQYSLIPTEGLSASHIPNDQFFYVNLSAAYYVGENFDPLDAIIYAMDEGPGTDCKIAVGEDSTEDLYCVLEVMEGDLWFHNIVLEYNVPEEMCAFLSFEAPWHLNQKTGRGPTRVYECSDFVVGTTGEDEETEDETEVRYCLGGCQGICRAEGDDVRSTDCNTEEKCEAEENNCGSDDVAGTWTAGGVCQDADGRPVTVKPDCTDQTECTDPDNNCGSTDVAGTWLSRGCLGGGPFEEVEAICGALDRSEQDLANCCFGEYTLRNQAGSTESQWGGNFQECIGGPGRFAWDEFNKGGEPVTVVTNTLKDGLKETYELPALINVYDGYLAKCDATTGVCEHRRNPTFMTANYWSDVDEKDFLANTPKFYKPATKGQLPEPYFNPDNRRGYPYFTWTCMDKAREVRHRIHLTVREWNTQKEYNKFKETAGSSGDPDIVGAEGDLCDYYESDEPNILKDTDCNDALDIDDWDEGSNYGTGQDYDPYPKIIYQDSN